MNTFSGFDLSSIEAATSRPCARTQQSDSPRPGQGQAPRSHRRQFPSRLLPLVRIGRRLINDPAEPLAERFEDLEPGTDHLSLVLGIWFHYRQPTFGKLEQALRAAPVACPL
jgi:hypothetical protein